MNKFMKRLSRSSFGQSSSNLNAMTDISQSSDQTSQSDSLMSDSDSSAMEDSLPPQIPPPPPPRPPPRRRRKQTTVFYSPLHSYSSDIVNKENNPAKRPPVPPPIPPRTVSMDESAHKSDCLVKRSLSHENRTTSASNRMFSNEELIENLMQNLSVMEELNNNLRSELRQCVEENSNLANELVAIHIERDQMLQTCKEIEHLKDNEWVCSVCLDDRQLIVSTNRQIVATFCGHIFCNECVNMALNIENVCPTCRKAVPQKRAFHSLYF